MTQPQPQIYKIPTKTYLKKFILKLYNQREPMKLDETTSLGKNLMSSMVDKLEYVTLSDQLKDSIQVTLSKRFAEKSPRVKRLVYINSLLEEMFRESMFLWIYAKADNGIPPNQSVKDFLAFFSIDDSEYSYDAAYKAWLRYRTSNSKNKQYLRKFPQNKMLPNLSRRVPTPSGKR